MSYPRAYPISTGAPLDENDYNALRNILLGFTPSGVFRSGYAYLIVSDGTDYYACNAYQTVYGGPSDVGGIDGADFEAVFKACLADDVTIILDGSGGAFEVTSVAGLFLAQSTGYGNLKNVTIIGVNNAKLLYTYSGGAANSLFYISDGWENTLIENVCFDMNYTVSGAMPIFPVTASDTGVVVQSAIGLAWIVGVTTHAGQPTTQHVTFRHCQFLHSPGSTLNIAAVNHVYFIDCLLDGAAEHILYTTENSGGTDCYDIQFIICRMFNYAKQWRGYVKLTYANNSLLSGCYCDPNQDGLGIPGVLNDGEVAKAYGPVIAHCSDTTLRDCYFYGDATGHVDWYSYGIDLEPNNENITLDNVSVIDWTNIWVQAGTTNTKVYGGKYEDTPFTDDPTVARGVQIVTSGVTTIYDYTEPTGASPAIINGTGGNSEDYTSSTTFTHDDGNVELLLDGTTGTAAGTTYTVINIAGGANYARVSVDNAKGFYYEGVYHNDADVGDWTIIYTYEAGSSITVMAKGDGNWFVLSKIGIWLINNGTFQNNNGTSTVANGATSATITHGLNYTPKREEITITWSENPTNTPGVWWISNITATEFTVNVENDPGASGLDFAWAVRRIE